MSLIALFPHRCPWCGVPMRGRWYVHCKRCRKELGL